MDQQPKIPTLKDAQKPQVKIKGMGAGLTLFDRLKQFKKKDLAFILAGLGTLFMAPLAEHFMMAPENGDASLQQGWGKGGTGGNFFGSGSSPYESGNSLASGGAIGGSGDIITPLNVRDPSSLVMGPGGMQQPPAGSAAPAAPPPTAPASNETDYRDALKGAATRAASAAVKKAPLPVPKVALGGSGLRGLGVAGGGSSASGSSLPIGPAAGSVGGPGGGGMRLVRATPGFKGVAGGRSPTGGTGLDNTKKAGANAGDAFNRAGSAAAGLNAAASETIPTGGQGFGGGGQGGSGANDKPGSGTGPGGSKSVGESLAFLRAKQIQENELKLQFEKDKLKDGELLFYGIANDSAKELAKVVTTSAGKWISKYLDPSAAGGDASATISCPGGYQGLLSGAPMCGEKPTASGCVQKITTGGAPAYTWLVGSGSTGPTCRVEGGKAATDTTGAEGAPSTPPAPIGSGGMSNGDIAVMNSLGDVCKKAITEKTNPDAGVKVWAEYLGNKANHLASANKALLGDAAPAPCVAAPVAGEKSLKQLQAAVITAMSGAGGDETAALTGKIKAGAKAVAVAPVPLADIVRDVKLARGALDQIKTHVAAAPAVLPIPSLYQAKEKEEAVKIENQITTASNNVDRLVTNLETVQTGIEEQLVDIQRMVGPDGTAGPLKVVQTRNEELKKVADKTVAPEYGGLAPAPAVTIPETVRNSDEGQTQQAADGAQAPISTADTKVEEYKAKKAEAEPAEPAETKPARDAAAETAKAAADQAVKDAVAKVGDAQTHMTGWAEKSKTALNGLAPMVTAPPAPTPTVASTTP